MKTRWTMIMVLVATLGGFSASAGLIVNITEESGSVVATASGTLDLFDLSSWGPSSRSPQLYASSSYISLGVAGDETRYFPISGPSTAWGTDGGVNATTASGDRFAILGMMGYFATSTSYVSGSELYSTATFNDYTLGDLGLTQATYIYTFGSGDHADSITVNVIPEPASAMMLVFGAGVGMVIHRARRSAMRR